MAKVSKDLRNSIRKHLGDGLSVRQTMLKTGASYGTVRRERASVALPAPKHSMGRPSLLNERMKKYCVRAITNYGLETAVEVKNKLQEDHSIVASANTVRRALTEAGLVAFVKPKKPLITEVNRVRRLNWARMHQHWTIDDWKRVIWSDEVKINRYGSDGKNYAWKRPHENLQPRHVQQTVKHGGGNIMVWSCITWEGVGYLTKIDTTMDKHLYLEILKEDLWESIHEKGFDPAQVIFQQDNDPKHKSHLVRDWLAEQPFAVMEWPAQSPDLNPIENMWALLKQKLFRYETVPKGMNELWERAVHVWYNEIPKEVVRRYIESMPDRCKAVIKANGRWTKY